MMEIKNYRVVYANDEYTPESVKKVRKMIKRKHGRIDAITLNYYLAPMRFGGLGYGKLKMVI
jgi:hypothetical protein